VSVQLIPASRAKEEVNNKIKFHLAQFEINLKGELKEGITEAIRAYRTVYKCNISVDNIDVLQSQKVQIVENVLKWIGESDYEVYSRKYGTGLSTNFEIEINW